MRFEIDIADPSCLKCLPTSIPPGKRVSELSEDSVHVTNEKNTNHLDLDHPKRGFDATKDYGFTAHDAYMYIRCNKIDEAMKIELGEQTPVDYKKLLFIVIGVFVAFIVFYFMYMQR